MLHHRISIITILLATLLLASCASRQTASTLNDVETYIQERPDSALATIRAIDTTTLTTRSLRAHYALLHAMALDKNWIDTTDVNVVMPAVGYYAKHGTADQKMKAYYYLGRIQQNGHDMNAAIISLTQAETASTDSQDDSFKGLLSMVISEVYKSAHYSEKEREYIEKGMDLFQKAGDTAHYNLSYGRLAMSYQEKHDWDIADSLYRKGIELAKNDTAAMRMFLVHYATMKVTQPVADPQGAVDLLNRAHQEYTSALPIKSYGVYAYASALAGDNKTCNAILDMFDGLSEQHRKEPRYYQYLISKYREDYSRALKLLEDIYSDQDKTVDQMLNNSFANTLKDYYQNQAVELKREAQIQKLTFLILLLALLLVVGVVILAFRRKRNREKQEAEQLVQLAEESARMMQQTNALLFKNQFSIIGDLCKTYLRTEKSGESYRKDAVYRRVQDILSNISNDDSLHAQFEEQINHDYFNIIDHIKADLGELSPTDERFLCYMIAGFDSSTISSILGLSLGNVYTKRSRLKDRIRQLDSPYKEQYLQVI